MKKYTVPAIAAVVVAAGVAGIALTNEKPLASVNGVGITKEMVDAHVSTIPAQLIQNQEAAVRKNILDRLVEQELVLQSAEKSGVTTDDDYTKALDELTRKFTYNFMVNRQVAENMTEDKVRSAYEERKATFVMPRAKARHILVKTEDEAKALITALEAGSDFVTLAKEKSIGPSASNGGDLGEFSMADMVPAFSQAAFALEAGQFSKTPVQTQFGWHVILLESKNMNAIVPFEAVSQQLAKQLSEQMISDYLKSLKEKANVEYFDMMDETAAVEAQPAS